MHLNPIEWTARALRKVGNELLKRNGIQGTWLDVGAHHGETTIGYARHNPGLQIFAFEPNLRAAVKLMGHAPNYMVVPMAVAEHDGSAHFHVNAYDEASSLLPLNEEAVKSWVGVDNHKVNFTITVPTIRLDTFLDLLEIQTVDYLKVDTQGMDLAVLKSAGTRLRDISKLTLEVGVAPQLLYEGAASKDEVMRFLGDSGFALVGVAKQTHGQEENLTFVRKS